MLAIEGASLVRQLDQLVEAGLVERREDTIDRRAKTLHLTPAGIARRAKIEASLDAMRASCSTASPTPTSTPACASSRRSMPA